MARPITRRGLLAGLAIGLAGCAGGPSGSTPTATSAQDTLAEDDVPGGGTGSPATPTVDGLDLREANVMAVEIEPADGDYRFSVTLYHDDDGEAGYANWWQVEAPDGTRLGRRELLHAHGTQEFTRSATIAVSEDLGCVVVRGHDETHGYGGRAMIVTVETGATRAVEQGPDPRTYENVTCP